MDRPTWVVVGLGNPGPEYARTRHNIGYRVVDELATQMRVNLTRHRRSNADTADTLVESGRIILMKSRTFMNESGGPVSGVVKYANVAPTNIVVIHDELDIPFGVIRIKAGGGDGGHNGIKSIKKSLGSGDFYRVRVGIGRPPGRQDPADFVLKPFNSSERVEVDAVIASAADAVLVLISEGLATAQNRFHSQ